MTLKKLRDLVKDAEVNLREVNRKYEEVRERIVERAIERAYLESQELHDLDAELDNAHSALLSAHRDLEDYTRMNWSAD